MNHPEFALITALEKYIKYYDDDFQPLYSLAESKKRIRKYINEIVRREMKRERNFKYY